MSRKNKRLKGLTEQPAKKGHFLTEEMDDVTRALVQRDAWDHPPYAHVDDEVYGTALDETRPGYTGRGTPATTLAPAVRQSNKPQVNMALFRQLLKMQGVMLGPPEDIFALEHDITWVVAGNGIFQVRKTQYGVVCVKVEKVSIDSLPDWKPPAYHWPLPKMPWSVFAPAIAFLRWVKERFDTEGLIRGYWNEAEAHMEHAGWTIHVPEQRVSGASVDVANTVEDPGLGLFALELHSHPGNSSTFSGTDDANEQRQRMFGCVAGLTNKPNPPNFHWRIGTGAEHWAEVDLDDIVSVSDTLTFNITALACIKNNMVFDPFQTAAFPEEWKEMVTPLVQRSVRYYTTGDRAKEGLATEEESDLLDRFRENEEKWYRDRGYTFPNGPLVRKE